MNVLTKFTETKFPDVFAAFAEIFKKHPAFIDFFSPKNRMEILNNFPESFAAVFKKYPPAIQYFSTENQMKIKKMFPDAFKDTMKNFDLRIP